MLFYVVESNVCMVYPIRCALFIKFVLKVEREKAKIKLLNKKRPFFNPECAACRVVDLMCSSNIVT